MRRTPQTGFGYLQAALPVAAVVIEFCWLYPWILFLTGMLYGGVPTPLLPAGPAFLLFAISAVAVRRVLATDWPLRTIRVTIVGLGLLAGLLAVKATYYPAYGLTDPRWIGVLFTAAHDALPDLLPPVAAGMTAALLWWRGVVLGEREFTYTDIDRLFRTGIGWSVLFVVLFAIYHDTRAFALASSAPAYLLAFFSLGLTALAIARLVDLWTQSQADDQQALAMNRHWLLLLVGVVGLILLVALLISGAMPADLRPTLGRLFTPLAPVVEGIFYVIFAIALAIARVILLVLSQIRIQLRPIPTQPDPFRDLIKQLQDVHLHPTVVTGARWGMVLLVVVLLCMLIALAIVRARRRQRKPGEDERESVWSTRAMLDGLQSALRAWWGRRRPAPGTVDTTEVAIIRALYRDLLRIGREAGVPRRDFETPYEYRPRISGQLQAVPDDVSVLTEAYVRVRYSPDTPAQDEVERARAALERIRNSLADA